MYENKRLTAQHFKRWSPDQIVIDAIVDFIPPGRFDRVLDYGAGNSPYRHAVSCNRYVTADITQNLEGDIDHLIVLGERLPFEDQSFELILLLDVLEHVPDPDFVLHDLCRLLAPSGRLVISVPFIYREHETPDDFRRYTAFGMRELVHRHGGTVARITKVGNVAYTLLSLFIERGIANGEKSRLRLMGRGLNRVLRIFMRLLGVPLAKPPREEDGIYHHLLLEVRFS